MQQLAIVFLPMNRRYAVVDPDKHLQVFTPINTKLLLVGLYMLSVLLCAGPLYGWGEYSSFKGYITNALLYANIINTLRSVQSI